MQKILSCVRSIKTMTWSSKINRTDVWSLYQARHLNNLSFHLFEVNLWQRYPIRAPSRVPEHLKSESQVPWGCGWKPGLKGALQKWKPRLQVKADRSQGSIAMSRKGHLTWKISNTNIKCDYATNRSLSSILMTRNLVRWQTHQFHTLHCYRRNWARMFFWYYFVWIMNSNS